MQEDELLALERRGWDALCTRDGARFYEDVMADDGLMVFPGVVMTKTESIAAIKGAAPWVRYDLRDAKVVRVGEDGALVTYRAVASRAAGAQYDAMMTSVYAKRAGSWKLVLHQQTPVTSGG